MFYRYNIIILIQLLYFLLENKQITIISLGHFPVHKSQHFIIIVYSLFYPLK